MTIRNRKDRHRIGYTLVGLVVLAVNLNVLHPHIAAAYTHVTSHREDSKRQYGVWDVNAQRMPANAIHAALLKTGKVLIVAGSGNDEKNFDNASFSSVLWDPTANTFKTIDTPWDAFCAGHAFLPDGRLLVAGGTKRYEDLKVTPKVDYAGLRTAYIFDPVKEKYERAGSMDFARWYPTLVGLGDGKVLASSGLDQTGKVVNGNTEIFDPATKQWTERKDLNRVFPTYPALFLTMTGDLFYTASNAGYGSTTVGRAPGTWDLDTNTFTEVKGLEDPTLTETSASVLLPPAQAQRFMIMGGGGIGDSAQATDRTSIVDLTKPDPHYHSGPDLDAPTRYPNAVILPDDTVLKTGGSTGYRTDNLLSAQIYNPKTNTFSKAAAPTVGRNYHAEALLLPDGRVATFGSNPIDNSFEMRIEVYSPAYLFRADRPLITSAPASVQHGETVDLKTLSAESIKTAKLMRPSAVTHVTDVEQRTVALDLVRASEGGYKATIPASSNLLPAGWYMLFVTDSNDTPSTATWVQVQ